MRFKLNPHTKAILCGRGMCKEDRLLCASDNCIFHPENQPDPDFGKEIRVRGYGVCSMCKSKTDWSEREWNDRERRDVLKCGICKKRIPKSNVVWTQEVMSKHRRKKHFYYHIECYDAMFFDIPDDDDSAYYYGFQNKDEFVRLIKWARRA